MTRLIEPPREQLGNLPTPLTNGERRVIELFDAQLAPEWEIYVQPHLNGLRPDIVLLNPHVGIAVFEIKDWDLRAMHYFVATTGTGKNTKHVLMARDRDGNMFSKEHNNPVNKIRLYKEELFELYCPRLDEKAGFAVITAGLIFPCARRKDIEQLLSPFRDADEGMQTYPTYYPIAGSDDLQTDNMVAIFPESRRSSSKVMRSETADDLRAWLREPFFSREQRQPLEMDERQRDLASTRTDSGYRRIKGPAGSGKSVILAARASSLAAEGKHVLVVCYNITLLNYLRDLAVRHVASRSTIRRQIDFLNFHRWCRRVCLSSGHLEEYNGLWASSNREEADTDVVLNDKLPELVKQLYTGTTNQMMPRYDAILVDEGQDLRPEWWQVLRLALRDTGEMLLVADKTQNIYSTASAWTDDAMRGCGFRGDWSELKISYRLPPKMIALAGDFAREFLSGQEIDAPQVEPRDNQFEFADMYPVMLRWLHVRPETNGLEACVSELRRMMQHLRPDTSMPDITFLSGANMGIRVAQHLAGKRVKLLHTFHEDKQAARRQKRAFFQGAAQIKATTLHSFKGWEARHLVLFVASLSHQEDKALLYTALTRLRRHPYGSCLTVISACDELREFGRTWPDFEEI